MTPDEIRQIAIAMLCAEPASENEGNWTALTRGRFALVDQFDREGRRYVIAERARESRSISDPDWQMLVARARGSALKVIASELGLSVPAVSRRVRRAMGKLGLRSQSELARLLSTR